MCFFWIIFIPSARTKGKPSLFQLTLGRGLPCTSASRKTFSPAFTTIRFFMLTPSSTRGATEAREKGYLKLYSWPGWSEIPVFAVGTVLCDHRYGVGQLRRQADIDGCLCDDSELVPLAFLQASHHVVLCLDVHAVGIAACPLLFWKLGELHIITNQLAATIMLRTAPDQRDRVLGHIHGFRFARSIWVKRDKSFTFQAA